ncbi:MAG: family 16 glycoside hydrolase [Verrucomicrobiota bacterium]
MAPGQRPPHGDQLILTIHQATEGKPGATPETLILTGKRIPPHLPRSNLSKIVFSEFVRLFNGRDLTGWKLCHPEKKNRWRAENGLLINETPKTNFSAYGDHGNLRTEDLFEDFELTRLLGGRQWQ